MVCWSWSDEEGHTDVYAFGIYVDEKSLKEMLVGKYGKLSVTELEDSKKI